MGNSIFDSSLPSKCSLNLKSSQYISNNSTNLESSSLNQINQIINNSKKINNENISFQSLLEMPKKIIKKDLFPYNSEENLSKKIYLKKENTKIIEAKLRDKFKLEKNLSKSFLNQQFLAKSKEKNSESLFIVNRIRKIDKLEINDFLSLTLNLEFLPFFSEIRNCYNLETHIYVIQDYVPNNLCLTQYIIDKNGISEEKAKILLSQIIIAFLSIENNLNLIDLIIMNLDSSHIWFDSQFNCIKINLFQIEIFYHENKNKNNVLWNSPEFNKKNTDFFDHEVSFTWKIGVFLYFMLTTKLPFKNNDEILDNFNKFHFFSGIVKDFFEKTFCENPKKRLKIKELIQHDFFKDIEWEKISKKNEKILDNFKETSLSYLDQDF